MACHVDLGTQVWYDFQQIKNVLDVQRKEYRYVEWLFKLFLSNASNKTNKDVNRSVHPFVCSAGGVLLRLGEDQ